eukprot:TRINITY_DN15595_c0_g1_i1.p1 TRINITY_DN15595_c0_g1~~TRINITY_DN15595_c0_g1_i1.p1  ORF type:complete len:143 (+),score=34.55 TRINITY_DN15595_c0_g1_i1:195-623(+)
MGFALVRWFLFGLLIVPALHDPASYDLIGTVSGDLVTDIGMANLKQIAKYTLHVADVPSSFTLLSERSESAPAINLDASLVRRYRASLERLYRRILSVPLDLEADQQDATSSSPLLFSPPSSPPPPPSTSKKYPEISSPRGM